MSLPRRDFLEASGRFLLLTGAAGAAWEFLQAGEPGRAPEGAAHWWAFALDIERCIGCGACVRACRKENDVPEDGYRTWVERYRVPDGELHPEVDSPKGGQEGFPPSEDSAPLKAFFVPKLCNHCVDSPCVQVCPVGATFDSPEGVVLVDKQYCLGCRYCVQACPYGCRYIDPRSHVVDKCTLCYHRLAKGLTTACCEVCPTGARRLGDLKDPKDPIHAWLRTHKVQVLKPQLATGSKAFYNGLDGSVR